MADRNFLKPLPRPHIADPDLVRPDWTKEVLRDQSILWLDKNENSDPVLADVTFQILTEIPKEVLYSYPESGHFYRKLAGHLDVEPSNLLLAAGSDGAIRSAFEAFVSPGEVVLITQPTFAMYAVYSRIYGADARKLEYLPSKNGPVLPAETMIDAIKESQPKMVCLPNPDSPTGTVFNDIELRAIIESAGEVGALMLVDEAYYPFYPKTVLPWIKKYPHLMVTRSTGKAWGLAGFRLGYAAASKNVTKFLHKVRSMYETNTVALAVMERLLDREDEMIASVKRLEAGKKQFLENMRELGFNVLENHGNFLHVNFGNYAEEIHSALSEIVYYRKDFNEPCLKGFSRFSATTPQRFKPVIDCIRQIVMNR